MKRCTVLAPAALVIAVIPGASAQSIIDIGIPEYALNSHAVAVSADGMVVTGHSPMILPTGHPTNHALRWTRSGGLVNLGQPPTGANAFGTAVNADGTVIVGHYRAGVHSAGRLRAEWSGPSTAGVPGALAPMAKWS
jgi:uncharacterized membrane protein